LPYYIIKIDKDMNPVRDKRGYCIECANGERGLLVGIIGNTTKTAYVGYANNKKASEKKIIENVFKNDQKAFNTGDVMVGDALGYLYFADRLGDTYRWRGENVATIEVENALSSRLNSSEVVVYGVEVPGQEGKAGMAAIILNNTIDMDKLAKYLINDLPAYARPIFIRLVNSLDHTGIHFI
jgi:acyl-CoA synthetase (AMP-forming)/AMP-acid ligase II